MQKPDLDYPKLTANDRKVLKKLIEHAKIPDSKIADEMGISAQAVFKIRLKLEKLGIIKSYSPVIDFSKIGINVLVLIIINFKSIVWEKHSDDFITDQISKIPHIISAYRVANNNASHIFLMGFRDIAQKEHYLTQIQTKYANEMNIKEAYTFSTEKIITLNPYGLLHEILDKTDSVHAELFPFLQKK